MHSDGTKKGEGFKWSDSEVEPVAMPFTHG